MSIFAEDPVDELPAASPAAMEETTGQVSARARRRVTIAPPEPWICVRELDETFAPAATGAYTILLFDQQHLADTRTGYTRVAQRLETVQAVHEAAQWRLAFDPATQAVVIHSLSVRRGGAGVEHAHAPQLRFLEREESLERLVIDGRVTVVVLIEDVRVGDILDASFTMRTTPRLLPENFWLLAGVPAQVPLRAFHCRVRFPAGRAMRWKSSASDFAPTVCETEGGTEWSWCVENTAPEPAEANVPAWHITGRWLQVSDLASWAEVAAGMLAAWPEDLADPGLVRAAEEIAAAAATPGERAERALALVQDEIRYLSVNTDFGGQIPAPPGTVLRRRFGDCKDKSWLAALLLRRLGLGARPVLVDALRGPAVADLLPMPDAFNHAIVEFEIDGARRWADATLMQQGGKIGARWVPDFRAGLPLAPRAAHLEKLGANFSTDQYELRETFLADTTGRPTILQVEVTARGRDAETLRRSFAIEGREAVAQKREQFYRQFFPKLRRLDTLEWRDERAANRVLLAEIFEVPEAFQADRDPQAALLIHRAHIIQSILAFPDAAVRRHPLALPYPCNVEHRIEFESPALGRGENTTTTVRDGAFRFSCSARQEFGRLVVCFALRTMADSVPPKSFGSYAAKVRELWPSTTTGVRLPLGQAQVGRGRSRGPLLPAERKGAGAKTPGAAGEEVAAGTLSAEPALALGSNPAVQITAVEKKTEAAAVEKKPPAKARRPEPAEEDGGIPQTASFDLTSGRGRRRRRRSKRRLWIIVTICTFVAVALVIFFFAGK